MGKLDIGATDYLYRLNNGIGVILKSFLQFGRDCQHRGGAERVAGMHTHRVNVFNETNGYHLVLGIAHYFELQFFPADHRLFY